MDRNELEEILIGWIEDNPDKEMTRSCPNFETNNSIFVWYKETDNAEEQQIELFTGSITKTE